MPNIPIHKTGVNWTLMFTLEIELEIVCTYRPVFEDFSDKTKEEIINGVNVTFLSRSTSNHGQ